MHVKGVHNVQENMCSLVKSLLWNFYKWMCDFLFQLAKGGWKFATHIIIML